MNLKENCTRLTREYFIQSQYESTFTLVEPNKPQIVCVVSFDFNNLIPGAFCNRNSLLSHNIGLANH